MLVVQNLVLILVFLSNLQVGLNFDRTSALGISDYRHCNQSFLQFRTETIDWPGLIETIHFIYLSILLLFGIYTYHFIISPIRYFFQERYQSPNNNTIKARVFPHRAQHYRQKYYKIQKTSSRHGLIHYFFLNWMYKTVSTKETQRLSRWIPGKILFFITGLRITSENIAPKIKKYRHKYCI